VTTWLLIISQILVFDMSSYMNNDDKAVVLSADQQKSFNEAASLLPHIKIEEAILTEKQFDEYLHSDFICMVDFAIIDDVKAITVFGIKDGEITVITQDFSGK